LLFVWVDPPPAKRNLAWSYRVDLGTQIYGSLDLVAPAKRNLAWSYRVDLGIQIYGSLELETDF
jgi:hypothetical protein